ncbi:MAG: APC family permease [Candidatus Omnitrophota bacterium]|nr:APC family permease [Candidatus Omnitrophota bacterium]
MEKLSLFKRVKNIVLGKAHNLRDPRIFHKLSLIAFFAWVGLGADGLSSSCYGPEEAFRTLGSHAHLGVFVALATAITVFVIASSYSHIIELFPSGGGGYLVASKLLSPSLGMVSGCALLIDYVLTITISVASGADAIFSFLPINLYYLKLPLAVLALFLLIVLNMRGVKDSVMPLIPVFMIFLITHVFIIVYGFVKHSSDFGMLAGNIASDVQKTQLELGTLGMFLLIMRAYSMGAGTYTGIEAVSNGLPILREPRVETGKKTMRYMAISLAFVAAGLMLGYLFFRVSHQPGKTFNAILLENVVAGWGNSNLGYIFILVTLISEAALLFVAAQAGFLDGPRVLANMAKDRWFPFQFALMSERFVIKNGILIMGISAFAVMLLSKGSVKLLVVLYSINVFITFFLSQLGMVRHWWKERKKVKNWFKKITINGLGLMLTAFILASVVIIKFHEGGWITLLITGALAGVAIMIKRYYYRTQKQLMHLDRLAHVTEITKQETAQKVARGENGKPKFDPDSKIAVILVSGFNGMGLHTLFNVVRLFGDDFKNFFFMEAGMVDAGNFKGAEEMEALDLHVREELSHYVGFMERQGFYARSFHTTGIDVSEEISKLAQNIFNDYPQSVFFGGQIVFPEDTFFSKLLYNHTTFAVQRRLHQYGIPFIIMPIRIGDAKLPASIA